MNTPCLLAAGGDVVGLVIVVIVSLISVLGHLANAMKKPVPPAGQRPANAGGPQPNRDLSDEIDAFLKKVLKGKEGAPQQPPPQREVRPVKTMPPPARQNRDRGPVQAEVVPLGSGSRRPASAGRSQTDIAPRVLVGPGPDGGDVAAEADRLVRQTATLGDSIDRSVNQAEERMHETFDHDLGELRGVPGMSSERSSGDVSSAESDAAAQRASSSDLPSLDPVAIDMAADIRQMFGDPQDVRKAIILSEILSPPSGRW